MDQICPIKIFIVKNWKSEHHWIPLIQISLGTKFRLKLTILIFWPDLPKKGFSGLKQKKWTPHIFYIILHIQISLVRNFSSNWQFLIFGSNLHKKVFLVKNWKSYHHHWILNIQISLLVPNFCFNWPFWFFWPDFPKIGFFSGLKQKKLAPHVFYIFLHIQISLVQNFSSNWQFLFFGSNLHKKVFPVKNWKS